MEKVKAYEVIAARFQISGESARYFLGHVQKSFKVEKPPQQLIIDFMKNKKFKSLPEPHAVAVMMKDAGVWAQALHAEPPKLADEEDIYF